MVAASCAGSANRRTLGVVARVAKARRWWVLLVIVFLVFSPAGRAAGDDGVATIRAEPARGKLLVAARHLAGRTAFAETVVLLLDHGPEGSTGLVINRPSRMKLADVMPSRDDVKKRGDDLWIGGPVQPERVMLLARAPERLPDAFPVFDEVQVILTKFGMDRALGRGIPPAAVRAYAGYAGWSPGQLSREIRDGDWHVVDADVKAVFSDSPGDVWGELVEGAAGRWVNVVPYAPRWRTISRSPRA